MNLQELAETYPGGDRARLDALVQEYTDAREDALLELTKNLLKLNAGTLMQALQGHGRPGIAECFGYRFPGLPAEEVIGLGPAHLRNMAHALRPTYFEHLVKKHLNEGERLADIVLREGDEVQWDRDGRDGPWNLVIVNSGVVDPEMTRHCRKELAYLRETIEKYPDVQIPDDDELEEVAEDVHKDIVKEVVDYDGNVVERGLTWAARSLMHFGQGVGTAGLILAPAVPAIVLAVTEGQAFLCGRSDYAHATIGLGSRAAKTAALGGLAASLLVVDLGLITGPIVAAAKTQWTRMESRRQLNQFVRPRTEQLGDIIIAYDLRTA